MALIAHYRLDGDARDSVGGNDLSPVNVGTSIIHEPNGKLGGCYYRTSFNNSSGYFGSSKSVLLSGSHSYSCWAKVIEGESSANGLVTNHSHAHNTGSGITVRHISSTDYRISCNTGNGSSRTFHTYYGTTNIKDNWHHLTFVYDSVDNLISLWVDGNKEFETSYVMAVQEDIIALFAWSTTHLSSSRYRPEAYLDDVRIYDHALSQKEVRELAQAKVLHYKFDDFQEPTENYASPVDDGVNTWSGTSWEYENSDYLFGARSVKHIKDPSENSWAMLANNGRISTSGKPLGVEYTMSFWAKPLNDLSLYSSIRVRCELRTATGSTNRFSPINSSSSVQPGWHRYEATAIFPTHHPSTGDPIVDMYPIFGIDGVPSETIELLIDGVQLEAKKYSTLFVDGTRSGTVTDCSSQDNHATLALANTPRWVEDSRLGKGAYDFNGTSQFLSAPFSSNNLKCSTISFWLYINPDQTWGSRFDIISGNSSSGNGRLLLYRRTTSILTLYYHTGTIHTVDITNANSRLVESWNLITLIVSDGDNDEFISVHVNGTLEGNTSVSSSMNFVNNNIFLGADRGVGNYSNIKIDDVQIYATALSDDDIKALYQTRASLDNEGNLFL